MVRTDISLRDIITEIEEGREPAFGLPAGVVRAALNRWERLSPTDANLGYNLWTELVRVARTLPLPVVSDDMNEQQRHAAYQAFGRELLPGVRLQDAHELGVMGCFAGDALLAAYFNRLYAENRVSWERSHGHELILPLQRCRDCAVLPGQLHEYGCDWERCPVCDGQLIACPCIYTVNGMDRNRLEYEHPDIYANGPTDAMVEVFLKAYGHLRKPYE